MSKVSIIVPVYNVEKYLVQCLKSLVNQTLKDIEIICVNDGSTDSSLKILEKFALKDNRIKILNKENGGLSSARNFGIKEASGEYIGFVDSDDWVDKNYFEKLYNTAKKYDADVACAGFKRFVYGCGSVRRKFKKESLTSDINEKVKLAKIPEHNYVWNKIFNREAWLKSGLEFPEGRKFEDIAIVLKTLNIFDKFVTVPNTYYHYRRRKNSIIAYQDTKTQNDRLWAIEQMTKYAEENNITLKSIDNIVKTYIIKVFGIKTLKIKCFKTVTEILLFGIPIVKISEK